jgi:DNA-binding NarL/FixJ family response regulator
MADWLAAACSQTGLRPVVLRRPPNSRIAGINLVLWDAGLPSSGLVDAFQHLAACFVGTPFLVLLDFPRCEDVLQLRNAGAAAVIAKPIGVSDLLWNVRSALQPGDR